jgi:hypothetical protein
MPKTSTARTLFIERMKREGRTPTPPPGRRTRKIGLLVCSSPAPLSEFREAEVEDGYGTVQQYSESVVNTLPDGAQSLFEGVFYNRIIHDNDAPDPNRQADATGRTAGNYSKDQHRPNNRFGL